MTAFTHAFRCRRRRHRRPIIIRRTRLSPHKKKASYLRPQENDQFLQRVLGKFKLQDVDTADILLLLILFFLFEEKADDELLIALGLLLIL